MRDIAVQLWLGAQPAPNDGGETTLPDFTLPDSTSPDAGSGVDWSLLLTAIGTSVAVVSAVAVFLYWLVTRKSRAARAAREEQVSTEVAEMGDRIERLEQVVQAAVADAEGRRPAPVVRLLTADGAGQSVGVSLPAPPAVDIERLVDAERRAALSTLPPATKQLNRADESSLARQTRPFLTALAGALEAVNARYEAVTEDDRKSFERSVDSYSASLRAFVPEWLAYLEARREALVLVAQVDNSGGSPASDASVRLHFPDPCVTGKAPERPKIPTRPVFERRETAWAMALRGGLGHDLLLNVPELRAPRFDPPNLTGPFSEDGSVRVRFQYRSIPHHDPFNTDPFLVRIPEAGTYTIGWSVHASNLLRPEEGTLQLQVVWEEPDPTPVATLEQLLERGRGAHEL